MYYSGMIPAQTFLDLFQRLPGATAKQRMPMRKICMSTAIVGWPKAMFSTTLAIFRPTPGSLTSSVAVAGTSPPWSQDQRLRQRDHVLRLAPP